jgi:predicted TIM-barrel fold metal-dependent hydrolase
VSLDRRAFLLGALGAPLAACRGQTPPTPATPAPILDAHVHLFGTGDGGSGCFLSPAQRERHNYRFFLRLLDLREDGRMDETYVERLLAQLHAAPVQQALLFAQDGRYDRDGRFDRESTHFFTPNDWLFDVCARAPDRLLPCASINPRRRDALHEAERCKARGARAVKVHPPTQDVDPADPAFVPFWRTLAELGLVLIVHTGTEHASHVTGFEVCDPARLEPALREGCTVVAAHAGFGSFLDGLDFFPSLQTLVRRYDRLYCDTAVLASMFRWRNLPRLIADDAVLSRTIHGSDWPFPSNPAVFWNRLGPGALGRLVGERNLFARDLELKRALGLPDECFTRGRKLFGIA